jgi:hypothetical protein
VAGHIATSKRTDWCSPPEVVEAARAALGGTIHLDPCSNPQSIVGAAVAWEWPEHDGLVERWGQRTAYVNPPFGTIRVHRETRAIVEADEWKTIPPEKRKEYEAKTIGMWTTKARIEHERNGAEVCLLLPAAIDTLHWHRDVWPVASAVGVFKGRLQFLGAHESKGWCAPMACALAYFGHRPARFAEAFARHGKVVRP